MKPKIENDYLVVRCEPGGEVFRFRLDDIAIVSSAGPHECHIYTRSGVGARRARCSREMVVLATGRIFRAKS